MFLPSRLLRKEMFFRNFLSRSLAGWRALTPMDRNELVLKIGPGLISMFVACFRAFAALKSLKQPQRTPAVKPPKEPVHPSKKTGPAARWEDWKKRKN